MATQMTAARRGVATDEMKQVAKDEDVSLDWLIPKIARGSIIIPSNNIRPQKIHNVGIGKGLKTKVNVNIGTSTLNVNLEEEIEKAKVAVKYHADTLMDLSDGGDVKKIRQTLLDVTPITFGTVPIYEAYNYGVEVHKNPLNLTEDDYLNAFESNVKDGVDYVTIHCGITKDIAKEMKRGTYLIDISSEKSKVATSLSKMPAKINPICIHPMFGPGVKTVKGQNIISVPIKDAKKELTVAKSLFEGANFVTIDAIEHDKKIAVILGLTHMVNLVFAKIISKDEKTQLTEKMSGTTFRVQKILAESIMSESPELIETIISNPEIRRSAEELWKDVGRLLTAVQESKTEEVINYIKECQERLAKHSDTNESYKKLTKMVKAVEK